MMMSRHARRGPLTLALLLGLGAVSFACSDTSGHLGTTARLSVTLTGSTSTRQDPLPLSFEKPAQFTISVAALRSDGTPDTSFNGFVRISVKPGSVVSLTGDKTEGRNVQLTAGVANNLGVGVVGSFGDTHFWAEDIGYVPADPTRTPPPACSDGIDNNNNGLIDFPADPGCAFANDDDENGGSYSSGASDAVYFKLPRIADVRGVSQGGTSTAFPHQQILVDTGWRPDQLMFEYSTVVTRVSSDGFYATDTGDKRGFSSIFAFNFSAPPRMRVCDRLKYYGGTASDFFGFTEVGFPTWALEEWDPNKRDCLVPEPYVFKIDDLAFPTTPTTPQLVSSVSSLVRLLSAGTVTVRISSKFGSKFPMAPDYKATADASNCDLNHDGKVDFVNDPEKTCSASCTADPECTEYSNYLSRSGFRLVMTDSAADCTDPTAPCTRNILADGSTSPQFDPVLLKGQKIKSFSGTLRYFSGGSQYTVEARCSDDIVVDLNSLPVASNTACVHARTISDNNSGSN